MAKEVEHQENEISPVIDWEVLVETVQQHEESYIKDCILFCFVLPSRYQFTKDVLVWQWIAKAEDEMIEKKCTQFFESLLSLDCIVTSGYDHFVGQTMYEVGDKMAVLLQNQHLEPTYLRYLNSKQSGLAKIEHLSLDFTGLESLNFGVLKQCCRLQTLIIHGWSGPKIQHLPHDLFLEMKDLKILNLSRTDIEELPSSIENAEGLRYLDMSETPVRWLPECICRFSNLQTLKLDGCLSLDGLPMSTSELTNLRHLVLDVVHQLQSMPEGIGQLSKLQTLGAFLVSEDGCSRIRELKGMNQLKGSLRVVNLENVATKEEAAEAALCNKRDLKAIELQWGDIREEKNREEEMILESLQPPWGIRDLKILFYSGGRLPSCLVPLGELPSLKTLGIVENNEIVRIDRHFCSKRSQASGDRRVVFPKLEKLSFDSFSRRETWTGLEEEDLPNLQSLSIDNCPRLVHLLLLSHMKSLVHMEISCCRELSCFPTDGLPIRLESLMNDD
ncbi:Unknown protein [Striga hermonthica]|uniref:R13L1/DRL21-like LRR repeat region domain-containing protein n=1 Tax=Striga hermonthica TaxID=68872 RepID=A0A9N7NLV5_STRHE|nr:Unknown protein [Striga hermonthica]